MVAARELKLVQVHHINVPKVGYTLLLVILLFASCCCTISFIRIDPDFYMQLLLFMADILLLQ